MRVGYLGVGDLRRDVVFNVDDNLIETFMRMKMSKQVNYATHKIHGHKEIPELTGLSADKISFEMVLSAYLGVSPILEMYKLEEYMKHGTVVKLVLGTTYCGSWVIQSIPYSIDYVTNEGDITQITISVTLIEDGG